MTVHSPGLIAAPGSAAVTDVEIARAPLHPEARRSESGRQPRRIPVEDIIIIGRRISGRALGADAGPQRSRMPRWRLAVRLILVSALIGEIAFAVKSWPPRPIDVPDVSSPSSMLA